MSEVCQDGGGRATSSLSSVCEIPKKKVVECTQFLDDYYVLNVRSLVCYQRRAREGLRSYRNSPTLPPRSSLACRPFNSSSRTFTFIDVFLPRAGHTVFYFRHLAFHSRTGCSHLSQTGRLEGSPGIHKSVITKRTTLHSSQTTSPTKLTPPIL